MAKTKKEAESKKAPVKSKGGAPVGNHNAEKWDEKTVSDYLVKIELESKKADCNYIGTALHRVGLYSEIWAYWKDIYKENEVVFQPIKRIEQVFESKLYEGALGGKLNPAAAIFGLKNNYNWKDKTETDTRVDMSVKWHEEKTYE